MAQLCVNIDHVATIRNARGGSEPDPLHAAAICELAGAVGITYHLREDRRHIRDEDAYAFRRIVNGLLNMEMACTDEMVKIALKVKPDQVTLVPEKRAELTTEGGLDVVANADSVEKATRKLTKAGIAVSHFIDASRDQVAAARATGATHVEFHTGIYADHFDRERTLAIREAARIEEMCLYGHDLGLVINAGHGLNYRNVALIARLPYMNELNIGHALVGRAVMVGLDRAVRDMVALCATGSLPVDRPGSF
ncbi:pyridoxine 5'-phosphate synthase [bacterium]|nr:pyridoxine 5'-phosphate synthase [bacterium]